MLRWKTPIKNNDLLIDQIDFQGNQLSNKSMLMYIILVVFLGMIYLHQISKTPIQPATQLMANQEVDVKSQGAIQE